MSTDDHGGAWRLLRDKPRIFWGKVVALFVMRGWTPPPPDQRITEELIAEFERIDFAGAPTIDLPDLDDALPLTPRERDVIRFLMVGYSNVEISGALGITEQTVKYHLSNVYKKLGVTGRAQVVAMFHRAP